MFGPKAIPYDLSTLKSNAIGRWRRHDSGHVFVLCTTLYVPMVRFSILCQADQVWDGHARPIYCYSLNVCRYMRRRARRSRVKEPNNTL